MHQQRALGIRWISHQHKAVDTARRRAVLHEAEYVTRLEGPGDLRRRKPDLATQYKYEQAVRPYRMENQSAYSGSELKQEILQEWLSESQYAGQVAELKLPKFGSVKITHGDVLQTEADALLVPMVPNFLPARGFSLEVLELGSKELARTAYRQLREYLKSTSNNNSHNFSRRQSINRKDQDDSEYTASSELLGKCFFTNSFDVCRRIPNLAFCMMPYFWRELPIELSLNAIHNTNVSEGGPVEAARKLRYTLKRAFREIAAASPTVNHLVMTHAGCGLYGFEAARHSHILLEEAVEAILQVDEQIPRYTLQTVTLCDKNREHVESLVQALQDVEQTWIPEKEVITFDEWQSNQNRRLLEVTEDTMFGEGIWRRERVSFKRHHGLSRRLSHRGRSIFRKMIWRYQRLLRPPPLLVYRKSGLPVPFGMQPKAVPFFKHGISHTLSPEEFSGFKLLRVTRRGSLVGRKPEVPKWQEELNRRF